MSKTLLLKELSSGKMRSALKWPPAQAHQLTSDNSLLRTQLATDFSVKMLAG